MASSFPFQPTGLSQAVTVGGAASATISLAVQPIGSTVTLQIGSTSTKTNYVPRAVRISNDGTAAAFINFGATAAAVSTGVTIGMKVRSGTDVMVMPGGLPFLAAVCASTFTVTLSVTPGEGGV